MPLDVIDQLNSEKQNLTSGENNSEVNNMLADSLQKVIDKAKESSEAYEILQRVVVSFTASGKNLSDNLGLIVTTFNSLNNSVKSNVESASQLRRTYSENIFGGTVRGAQNLINNLSKIQEGTVSIKSIGNIFQKSISGGREFLSIIDEIKSKLSDISSLNISSELNNHNLPKFESGGVVGGNSKTGDKILARLNSGEWVLTERQMENVAKMLSHNAKKNYTANQVFKMAGGNGSAQFDGGGIPMFASGGKVGAKHGRRSKITTKVETMLNYKQLEREKETKKQVEKINQNVKLSDTDKKSQIDKIEKKSEDFIKHLSDLQNVLENLPQNMQIEFEKLYKDQLEAWKQVNPKKKEDDFVAESKNLTPLKAQLEGYKKDIYAASAQSIKELTDTYKQSGQDNSVESSHLKTLKSVIKNGGSVGKEFQKEIGLEKLQGEYLSDKKVVELLKGYFSTNEGKTFANQNNIDPQRMVSKLDMFAIGEKEIKNLSKTYNAGRGDAIETSHLQILKKIINNGGDFSDKAKEEIGYSKIQGDDLDDNRVAKLLKEYFSTTEGQTFAKNEGINEHRLLYKQDLANAGNQSISDLSNIYKQLGQEKSIENHRLELLKDIVNNSGQIGEDIKEGVGFSKLKEKDLTDEKILSLLQKFFATTEGQTFAQNKNIDTKYYLNQDEGRPPVITPGKLKGIMLNEMSSLVESKTTQLSQAKTKKDKEAIIKSFNDQLKSLQDQNKQFNSIGGIRQTKVAKNTMQRSIDVKEKIERATKTKISWDDFVKSDAFKKIASRQTKREYDSLNAVAKHTLSAQNHPFSHTPLKKQNMEQTYSSILEKLVSDDKTGELGARVGVLAEKGLLDDKRKKALVQGYLSKKENEGLAKKYSKESGLPLKELTGLGKSSTFATTMMMALANQAEELMTKFANLANQLNEFGLSNANIRVDLARLSTGGSDILAGQTVSQWGDKYDLTRKETAQLFPVAESFARDNNVSLETINTIADNLKNSTGVLKPEDLRNALSAIQGMTQGQVDAMMGGNASVSDAYGAAFTLMDNPSQLDAAIKAYSTGALTGETPDGLSEGDKALLENNQEILKLVDEMHDWISDLVPAATPYFATITSGLAKVGSSLLSLSSMGLQITQLLLTIAVAKKMGVFGDTLGGSKFGKMSRIGRLSKGGASIGGVKGFFGLGKAILPALKAAVAPIAAAAAPIAAIAAAVAIIAGIAWWLKKRAEKKREKEWKELDNRKDAGAVVERFRKSNEINFGNSWNFLNYRSMGGKSSYTGQATIDLHKKIHKENLDSLRGLKSYQTLVKQLSSGQHTKFEDALIKYSDINMGAAGISGTNAGFNNFSTAKIDMSISSFGKNMSVISKAMGNLAKGLGANGKNKLNPEHLTAAYVKVIEEQIRITKKFIEEVEGTIGRFTEIPTIILSQMQDKIANFQFETQTMGGGSVTGGRQQINEMLSRSQGNLVDVFSKAAQDINMSGEAKNEYVARKKELFNAVSKQVGFDGSFEDLQKQETKEKIAKSAEEDRKFVSNKLKEAGVTFEDFGLINVMDEIAKANRRNSGKKYKSYAEEDKNKIAQATKELHEMVESGSVKMSKEDAAFLKQHANKSGKDLFSSESRIEKLMLLINKASEENDVVSKKNRVDEKGHAFKRQISKRFGEMQAKNQLLQMDNGENVEAIFSTKLYESMNEVSKMFRNQTNAVIQASLNNTNSSFHKMQYGFEEQRIGANKWGEGGVGGNVATMISNVASGTASSIAQLEETKQQAEKNAKENLSKSFGKITENIKLNDGEKKDLKSYLDKRTQLSLASAKAITTGDKKAIAEKERLSKELEAMEKRFASEKKSKGFNDAKALADRAGAEQGKQLIDIAQKIEEVKASYIPQFLKTIEHLKNIETFTGKTFDAISNANKSGLSLLGRSGASINEIKASGEAALEASVISGESNTKKAINTYNTLKSSMGRDDFIKKQLAAGVDKETASNMYKMALATAGEAAIKSVPQAQDKNNSVIVETEKAANLMSVKRQEGLNLEKTLATMVGAPIQEILRIEKESIKETFNQYQNAKDRYQKTLEMAKKGQVSQEALLDAQNNMSKMQNKAFSEIIGAQRATMEQMFGRLIGTFKGQAGFAGASIYSKYGAGLSLNAQGQVVATGADNLGAHNSYSERIFGNQLTALGKGGGKGAKGGNVKPEIMKIIEEMRLLNKNNIEIKDNLQKNSPENNKKTVEEATDKVVKAANENTDRIIAAIKGLKPEGGKPNPKDKGNEGSNNPSKNKPKTEEELKEQHRKEVDKYQEDDFDKEMLAGLLNKAKNAKDINEKEKLTAEAKSYRNYMTAKANGYDGVYEDYKMESQEHVYKNFKHSKDTLDYEKQTREKYEKDAKADLTSAKNQEEKDKIETAKYEMSLMENFKKAKVMGFRGSADDFRKKTEERAKTVARNEEMEHAKKAAAIETAVTGNVGYAAAGLAARAAKAYVSPNIRNTHRMKALTDNSNEIYSTIGKNNIERIFNSNLQETHFQEWKKKQENKTQPSTKEMGGEVSSVPTQNKAVNANGFKREGASPKNKEGEPVSSTPQVQTTTANEGQQSAQQKENVVPTNSKNTVVTIPGKAKSVNKTSVENETSLIGKRINLQINEDKIAKEKGFKNGREMRQHELNEKMKKYKENLASEKEERKMKESDEFKYAVANARVLRKKDPKEVGKFWSNYNSQVNDKNSEYNKGKAEIDKDEAKEMERIKRLKQSWLERNKNATGNEYKKWLEESGVAADERNTKEMFADKRSDLFFEHFVYGEDFEDVEKEKNKLEQQVNKTVKNNNAAKTPLVATSSDDRLGRLGQKVTIPDSLGHIGEKVTTPSNATNAPVAAPQQPTGTTTSSLEGVVSSLTKAVEMLQKAISTKQEGSTNKVVIEAKGKLEELLAINPKDIVIKPEMEKNMQAVQTNRQPSSSR